MVFYGCPMHLQGDTEINDEKLFTLSAACLKYLRMPQTNHSETMQTVSGKYVKHKLITTTIMYLSAKSATKIFGTK